MAPKKKLRSNRKRLSIRSWFLIAGFVAIGAVAIYANAATSVSEVLLRTNNLAIGYTKNKPTVAARSADSGQTVYESRARAIDISKKGVLFCTPEDNGVVTRRLLTPDEKKEINTKIYGAAPAVDQTSLPAQKDLNEKTLYVDTTRANEQARVYAESAFGEYIQKTAEVLEGLCAVPGQPISDDDIEKLSLKRVDTAPESLVETVSGKVFPRVAAGGTAPKYGGNDTAVENIQHVRLADARKQAGVLSTYRTTCLDNAAREWSRAMATMNVLQHSNPINAIVERHCGTSWQRLGENVGTAGTIVTDSVTNSHNVSNAIFDAYMRSPGHRANIVDGRYTKHGVGAYKTADGKKIYTSQIFWR